MPLQDQELAIALGQGLDQKTDSKAVVAGKLLRLENGLFTEGHQIDKRPGYDNLTNVTFSPYSGTTGTLVAPKMVKEYNDELICADSGRLYSYSPNLAAWVDKGPYESIASLQSEVSAGSASTSQTYQSSALLGNYMLVSWQQSSAGTTSAFAAVIDITTGAKIYPDTAIAAGTLPIACALGTTKLAVFYVTGGNIVAKVFTISGGAVTVGAATSTILAKSTPSYAVANTSSGAVVTSNGATKTVDTAGAVVNSTTGFTRVLTPSITVGTNGNIWVYGGVADGGGNNILFGYIIYSATLTSVLVETAIATVAGSAGSAVSQGIVAVADSTTAQTAVMATNYFGGSIQAPPKYPITTKSVTSAGVISAHNFTTTLMDIYSKPFYIGTSRYILMLVDLANVAASYPLQPAVFLMNMDAAPAVGSTVRGVAVAKALVGTAPSVALYGYQAPVIVFSSTKIGFASAFLSEEILEGSTTATPINSSAIITFDWSHQDAYQSLVFNNQLLLGGGIVSMYDGNICAELGFHQFPVIQGAAFTTNAGNIPIAGNYLYAAIFTWVDNQGNLHSSAPSPAVVPNNTGGAANQTCLVTITAPSLTTKDPAYSGTVIVTLYRTITNGTTFYQVGHVTASANPTSTTAVQITDNLSDANLILGTPLYTTGDILENDPPPPCLVMNGHNNRVWMVDSTQNNTYWYSKTSQLTVGASFSGNLTNSIDSKGGGISGMVELDEKQILFKEDNRIVILYGDGANDTGAGSTISTPQFVQTDVGCSYSKSIISMPDGIIFKSPKGWYMLDRSTKVAYIGFPVEDLNAQDVTSAERLNNKTVCVFLTSSGYTVAYDYFFNQWSTFTNHAGYAATIFGGYYTYARTDGSIYKQNLTSYLDNTTSYLLKLQTSWLHVGKIQGFQRVRSVLALGSGLSPTTGHGLQISAAYDFVESFSSPIAYILPSASGPFQYREHLPRQKCDTVSLLIEEVSASAGASGEYLALTDLGFDAALKKGPNKLAARASVG